VAPGIRSISNFRHPPPQRTPPPTLSYIDDKTGFPQQCFLEVRQQTYAILVHSLFKAGSIIRSIDRQQRQVTVLSRRQVQNRYLTCCLAQTPITTGTLDILEIAQFLGNGSRCATYSCSYAGLVCWLLQVSPPEGLPASGAGEWHQIRHRM
jgi:hypothetical protein